MFGQVRIVSPTALVRYGLKEESVVTRIAPPNLFGHAEDVWVNSEKTGKPVMLGYYDYEKIEDSCKRH